MSDPARLMKLEKIRDWLDQIDDEILRLLHTRASLVREVARVKHQRAASLQASEREASLLRRVQQSSRVLGLDDDYTSELWSRVIWHAKQLQCRELGVPTFLSR